ncbi:KaiC domain-containing protein [Halobacteriales archaeon QS_3_64_16]|nr:MAG: KaiC domain-containing protein [Halobacteriales archaeon QS_3_64_16]
MGFDPRRVAVRSVTAKPGHCLTESSPEPPVRPAIGIGSRRELISDGETIGGYEAIRPGRSSVSDDPERSAPDDRSETDRPADSTGNVGEGGRNDQDTRDAQDEHDDRDDGERRDSEDEADGDDDATSGQRESGELFEEDFASAFETGGGAGGSGSAGSGDDPAEFESGEEFDSAIPRIDLGIEGLDAMVRGGIPERSLIAVIGSAGTGKTTVGLEFLQQALRNDEKAIFIALEESRGAVLDTAAEKGWAFERYCEEERLAVVDMDPIEMARSLRGIRSELPRLIAEFGASRVVLDSVSLLETMYDDPAKRRTEIFAFARSLKEAGVTTLLTSEAATESAYASRYGIVEYLTDAVFVLQYVRPSDFQETRLAVEIQKIRNADHSRETKPYEITNKGVDVHRQANFF